MAQARAPAGGIFSGRTKAQQDRKEKAVAITTVGYPRRRLHLNAVGVAVAVAALAGIALGVTQVAMDGGGGTKASTSITKLVPAKEPASHTMFIVASDARRAEIEAALVQHMEIAEVSGGDLENYSFAVVVIPAGAPDAAWQAVRDTESVRTQAGLPFTLVDLR